MNSRAEALSRLHRYMRMHLFLPLISPLTSPLTPVERGKLKTIGLGDMLMLWDGNVMYVLFEAGSEAVLSSE